jgi:peptidoglycan/xylan/chitin deacetylase (PgdA/CDA1 family)
MRRGLTVLMYHRVLPAEACGSYPLESLVMPQDAFDQQMRWLSARFEVLTLRDAVARLRDGTRSPKPIVSVTFDDGYFDNAEIAAPILESHGIRGTFFVTSDFVTNQTTLWFDLAADSWVRLPFGQQQSLLAELCQKTPIEPPKGSDGNDIQFWMELLKRTDGHVRNEFVNRAAELADGEFVSAAYRPMTRQQLRHLSLRGHEIASHTVTHPILTQLDQQTQSDELRVSRAALQDLTSDDVIGFCYPNGDHDSNVQAAVADAGYGYACTCETGLNNTAEPLLTLKRIAVTQQRVLDGHGQHDRLGFRAEVCRARELWR